MKETLLKSIQKHIDKKQGHFNNAEDLFNWWISQKSVATYEAEKRQMNLF